MKILRDSNWYKLLIQKLDHNLYTNPELYAQMDAVDIELGIPNSDPTYHSCVASRLVNLSILEAVPDDSRKGRGREKPMIFSVVSTEDLDEKLARKPSLGRKKATKKVKTLGLVEKPKTYTKEQEDAFIKYFRCVRTCARKHDSILTLNECKEVNNKPGKTDKWLVRINSTHVCHWAKVVQKLGAPVSLPVVHKEESGDVKIEFKDYEENLLLTCEKGQELFGYSWFDPKEAFGKNGETRAQRARYRLGKKALGVVEEPEESIIQPEEPKQRIELNDYQKLIVFMVGGHVRENGGKSSLQKITEFLLDQKVASTADDIEGILNECPEFMVKSGVLNEDLTKIVSFQDEVLEEDNVVDFWKNFCELYGPNLNEKEEILCRISMTKEEVSEILSSNTTEVETASQISEHDGIYRIIVSKNSAVDRMNMLDLIQKFRKDDVVLSHSEYTKGLLESVANFKVGNAFYRFEAGLFK